MMRVNIFDVGHGACSVITCPNGGRVMVDPARSWLVPVDYVPGEAYRLAHPQQPR